MIDECEYRAAASDALLPETTYRPAAAVRGGASKKHSKVHAALSRAPSAPKRALPPPFFFPLSSSLSSPSSSLVSELRFAGAFFPASALPPLAGAACLPLPLCGHGEGSDAAERAAKSVGGAVVRS